MISLFDDGGRSCQVSLGVTVRLVGLQAFGNLRAVDIKTGKSPGFVANLLGRLCVSDFDFWELMFLLTLVLSKQNHTIRAYAASLMVEESIVVAVRVDHMVISWINPQLS